MNKINKIIVLSIVDLLFFLLSFIFIINDLTNYLIVFVTLTIIFFIYLIYTVFEKTDEESIYKKKIKKILKTYDSILVYMEDDYKLNNENIMFVKKFEDLLIARDEVNNPILFIDEEKSSVFLLEDEERFSEEKARRRICSTSSGESPSSRAFPPSWKLASMKVQPSSLAASPTLKSSPFSSFGLYFVLRNVLMIFLALSIRDLCAVYGFKIIFCRWRVGPMP